MQDESTQWWTNPPLTRRTVEIATERAMRTDVRGSGLPRAAQLGGPDGGSWMPMSLVRRIHVPCFTNPEGTDLSAKETKRYGQQVIDAPKAAYIRDGTTEEASRTGPC